MSSSLPTEIVESGPIRSLTDWVADTLRQALIDGHFEPGERLDQDAIAEQLGVSRTPLREAIAVLESEGLLQSRRHRGVFVSEVSRKDIAEVFALRALLEAEVARQAASRIPDSVLDELEQVLQEAERAYENQDHGAQFEADQCFHETLCEYTENSLLKEVLDGINNRVSVVRGFAQAKPGPHISEFAREHVAILKALQQRDGDKAAALMTDHLRSSGIRVQELVGSSKN